MSVFFQSYLTSQLVSFPGAEGFGALATGGRGGKVIYVTNLNADGPGSLQAAINEIGKRYIVFKVSGVIPTTIEVPIGHGDFTLAGQTSPNGIIVRGFLSYNDENVSSNNIIIRHLRSRIGDRIKFPSQYWIAEDGLTLGGVHNAIIDHCSFAHASDEAVDISRSSSITIQNCLLAETLGDHSYLGGMLINYSSSYSPLDSLSIHHNMWNRIGGRMPEISCETPYCNGNTIKVELSDNLAWDPRIELWYEGPTGNGDNFYLHMNAINNLYHANSTYGNGMFHHNLLHFDQNQLYFSGNEMNLYPNYADYQLFYCCNDFNSYHPNTDFGIAQRLNQRHDFPLITYTTTENLKQKLQEEVGAFPRDAMDNRLMNFVFSNMIDPNSIDEDHYEDAFTIENDKVPPVDSDNDGMPDYWENAHGLDVLVQDHNGDDLSTTIYNVAGYTNLECYLNCLSDALVSGNTNDLCKIELDFTSSIANTNIESSFTLMPNPSSGMLMVSFEGVEDQLAIINITDIHGRQVFSSFIKNNEPISLLSLSKGLYFVNIQSSNVTFKMQKLIIM